jgi:CheY-like chemotaxis protein
MGGEVEILRTELGKGTQFQVVLPLKLVPDTSFFSSLSEDTETSAPRPLLKAINPESALLAGMKVLVVDDSADNCLLATRFLVKAGAQVISAPNGKVAVEMAFAQKPDVILMDSQMPEMNGYEATQTLIQKGFEGPIIALTAGAFPEDRDKCINAGCVALVTKPVQKDVLIQTIYQAHSTRGSGHRLFLAPTAKTDVGD